MSFAAKAGVAALSDAVSISIGRSVCRGKLRGHAALPWLRSSPLIGRVAPTAMMMRAELNRTASECASCTKTGVRSSASLHRKKRSGNIGREAAIKISIGWSAGGIERKDSLAQIIEGLARHVFGFHLRCVGTNAHRIAAANPCVANGHGH